MRCQQTYYFHSRRRLLLYNKRLHSICISVLSIIFLIRTGTGRSAVSDAKSSCDATTQLRIEVTKPFRMNQNYVHQSLFNPIQVQRRFRLSQQQLSRLQRIRGGSTGSTDDDDDDVTSNVDDAANEVTMQKTSIPTKFTPPVTILVQTNTGSKLIDPMIELPLVNPSKRTVLSIKQSIQRQLSASKPPLSSIRLVYQGQVLDDDDLLLADVLDDDDDDDDDDEDEEDMNKDMKQIKMYIDMIPPVDSKNYIYDLESKLDDATVAELLQAYTTNEAAIYYNTQQIESLSSDIDEQQEQEHDNSNSNSEKTRETFMNVQIRERSQQIRKDMEATVLHTSQSRKLLSETETPNQKKQRTLETSNDVEMRGDRIRRVGISGIRGNYIRTLQHELNIEDWYKTTKHSMLFLFFGYFGGRTVTSRTVLLLGAPIMILIQTRFMKLYLRRLLFTLLYHPPSIVLSLLPAPQQAILSLNMYDTMKQIYGEHIVIDELTKQLLDDDADSSNDDKVLTSKRFTLKSTADDVNDDDDDDEENEDDYDDEEDDDTNYDDDE